MKPTLDHCLQHMEFIYDTVDNAGQWQILLTQLVADFNGVSGVMNIAKRDQSQALVYHHCGYDSYQLEQYADYFIQKDVWSQAARNLTHGRFYSSTEFDQKDYLRSEFFNDYNRFNDIHHAMGTFHNLNDDLYVTLSIHRGKAMGAFSAEESRYFNLLAPHFNKAINLHAKVTKLTTTPYDGWILLDCAGNIIESNNQADLLLNKTKLLSRQQGKLSFTNTAQQQQFSQLLNNTIAAAQGKLVTNLTHTLSAIDEYNSFNLQLSIKPTTKTQIFEFHSRRVMAFVELRTTPLHRINWHKIATQFKLSQREMAVIKLTNKGLRRNEIAIKLACSKETVKSHVSCILNKSNCSNQKQLVGLINSMEFLTR